MTPRVRHYATIAAAERGIDPVDVFGRSRRPDCVAARKAVIRKLADDGFTPSLIARWLGRHHTTILHSLGRLA